MTKKSTQGIPPFPDNVKDSAQQIWLAGLGAFTKAQEEGSKVFDALVQEGLAMQRKTQTAAEAKLAEASQKMSTIANEISTRATGQWDKLENIFEDRVSKALHRLGVPAAADIQVLTERIEELSKAVDKLSGKPSVRAAAKKPARKNPSPSGRGRG
jgi:poly(hydroxyalkanoate) granule-associated protein